MIVPSEIDSLCTKPEAYVLVDSMFLQKMSFEPIIINRKIYLLYVKFTIISKDKHSGTEIVKRD
jgi:hypothetical protein